MELNVHANELTFSPIFFLERSPTTKGLFITKTDSVLASAMMTSEYNVTL